MMPSSDNIKASTSNKKTILEIIGYNIESCKAAQNAGAQRIELCSSPGEGGTTPSYGLILAARQVLNIPLYPIIRPRGGDFLYTKDEFNTMKFDINICKDTGCDGVVFGILNSDGSIDTKRCTQLIELAYPMKATFHRAFDRCSNLFEALENIIAMGFERILTSGQHPTAMEGAAVIKELIQQANDRIIIMPGSGINISNIISLANATGAIEFHSSAKTFVGSKMEFINERMNESQQFISTDTDEIVKMSQLLNTFFNDQNI